MTMYILALVPTKAEYLNTCLGCELNTFSSITNPTCRFNELCKEKVFKVRYMAVDSTQLVKTLPVEQL